MDKLEFILELIKISGVHGGMNQLEIDVRLNKVCQSFSEVSTKLNIYPT